jgi:hypothetical protein
MAVQLHAFFVINWMIRFISLPLITLRSSPSCPLASRPGGFHSRSEISGGGKNLWILLGIDPHILCLSACSLIIILENTDCVDI